MEKKLKILYANKYYDPVLVQACMQKAGLYSNKRTNLLHFNLIILDGSVV